MIISKFSEARLSGVHPDLVRVVRRAAEYMDRMLPQLGFVVNEGLRTRIRQAELVRVGASKTMDSRHITGHAVDLVATVAEEIRWDWPLYYKLADVVRAAAVTEDVPMVWGGVWDKRIDDLAAGEMEHEVQAYTIRRQYLGKKAFLDGPHFELDRARYPAPAQP